MAIIVCPFCFEETSDREPVCMHCGEELLDESSIDATPESAMADLRKATKEDMNAPATLAPCPQVTIADAAPTIAVLLGGIVLLIVGVVLLIIKANNADHDITLSLLAVAAGLVLLVAFPFLWDNLNETLDRRFLAWWFTGEFGTCQRCEFFRASGAIF